MRRRTPKVDLPCDYIVVGEHQVEPDRLLVLADDGRLFALNLADGQLAPTELHSGWEIDTCRVPEKLQHHLSLEHGGDS